MHKRFGALAPIDVLRKANADGPQVRGALGKVLAESDAAANLLSLFIATTAADTDEEASTSCTPAAKEIAFAELMKLAAAESVAALFELARFPPTDVSLDVYSAARHLPMAALLSHCGIEGDDAREAVEDADLFTVGDLVRYCRDALEFQGDGGELAAAAAAGAVDPNFEQHVGALALETGGVLGRPALRSLLTEARKLCAATAALRPAKAEAEAAPHHGAIRAWGELSDSTTQKDGDEDLADIDGGEEDGPLPGTRSVGC